MAQCKLNPQEFIKNTFTPQIAVMCSPEAERLCQKNNLSFIELLQPFSKLSSDLYFKDANNVVHTVKSLKLTFLDINSRPPHTTVARKYLNSSVTEAQDPRTQIVNIGGYNLEIPTSTPWFESWRDTFLTVQYPSDHEHTKHFLACMLVASSLDQKPVETMISMTQTFNHIVNNSQVSLPKWFSSNVLKYFVILHDNVLGDANIANEAYESLKSSFGAPNTFLLKINSRPSDAVVTERLPDPWSQFINANITSRDYQATPESSPVSARSNTLEVGQEINEGNIDNTYHPLSPAAEDLSLNESDLDNERHLQKPLLPKEHGFCLSIDDVESVKHLIFEFCKTSLIPYVERQIVKLTEGVSNKKGVSRSLFSATKRWFNPSKPGASAVSPTNLMYASDSPELQIRKLGDLFFMFGNYSGAFHAYHNAKRDYNADQAWLYYAGALEMASLSAFMANECSKKTCDYMEESILTYLSTCKMPQFATRATLLSTECLKHRGMYGEAAHQLIRMASEDSDLRSALLLEQAAYCFLQSKMIRKYAFHMVLSGHRFSKAAQRKHSLRCYKQAYQIYEDSGWDLAEDHINYTIGRQANNLQCYSEAVDSFAKLLRGESKQTAEQQVVFLKEYLTILESKFKAAPEEDMEPPTLPVPQIDNKSIKVLTVPAPPLMTPSKSPANGINFADDTESTEEERWQKLEELVVQEVQGALPLLFKPSTSLYNEHKMLKSKPIAIIHEPIRVSINLVNKLQIPLNLKDIQLVWSFSSESNDSDSFSVSSDDMSADNYVKTHVLKTAVIPEGSHQNVVLVLTPLSTGDIRVLGVSYVLVSSSVPTDPLCVKGRQMFRPSKNSDQISHNFLTQIDVTVVPPAPCLQVLFSEVNPDFLCDEIQRVNIYFQNTGAVALDNVHIVTSVPKLLSTCEFSDHEYIFTVNTIDCDIPVIKERLGRKNHVTSVPLPNDKLLPGQSYNIPIWIRAPDKKGSASIDLLIYYENVNKNATPRYRLVRHFWNLSIQESIELETLAKMSHSSSRQEEVVIPLTATNLNKTHYSYTTEITLLGVGLLSKSWRFMTDVAAPKYINLHSQESAHIYGKARRVKSSLYRYTNLPLNADKTVVDNTRKASVSFARKTLHRIINMFDDPEDIEDYKGNENDVLVLQWQALITDANKKRIVIGQSHHSLQIIRRKKDPYEDMEEAWMLTDFSNLLNESRRKKQAEEKEIASQNQVAYNVIYPPVIKHCFKKDNTLYVDVKFWAHSIVEYPLKMTICLTKKSKEVLPDSSNLYCADGSTLFHWVGNTLIHFTLDGYESKSLTLRAALPRPGTYDLGAHIEVYCANMANIVNMADISKDVLQTCQIQSALLVININSDT